MPKAHAVPPPAPDRPIQWVFLDRDGTLNVKAPAGEYIERPDQLKLLAGAGEAVRMLNRAGIWTGVVTNQRGIALGRMTLSDLDAVHQRLTTLLHSRGAYLDAIYTCPHAADVCDCRKPQPGLLLQAQSAHPQLDFEHAAIVGDSQSDVEAGRRLGLRTVLIAGEAGERPPPELADHVVVDILQAARLLVETASA